MSEWVKPEDARRKFYPVKNQMPKQAIHETINIASVRVPEKVRPQFRKRAIEEIRAFVHAIPKGNASNVRRVLAQTLKSLRTLASD